MGATNNKANDENAVQSNDKELDELFRQLGSELSSSQGSESTRASSSLPVSLSAFPTELSCTQCFNDLIHCYSIGGQARNIYRHGELNNCMDQRQKFKFCMSSKAFPEDQRKVRIARFYMERLARQKIERGSSEDVWTSRTKPLLNPFRED